MSFLANVLVAAVALLHVGFLTLEMFYWTEPLGRGVSGMSPGEARVSAPLAANQGLYNGFLAAGLVWALWSGPAGYGLKVFFLGCVIVAGVYGGATVKRTIFYAQALPGALALLLVWLAG